MATEALPVPAQLKAQLDKCKSVRSADTYCKSRAKTPEVSLDFVQKVADAIGPRRKRRLVIEEGIRFSKDNRAILVGARGKRTFHSGCTFARSFFGCFCPCCECLRYTISSKLYSNKILSLYLPNQSINHRKSRNPRPSWNLSPLNPKSKPRCQAFEVDARRFVLGNDKC